MKNLILLLVLFTSCVVFGAGNAGIVRAQAPVEFTSGQISMPQATSIADGYLSSADWAAFSGKLGSIALAAVDSQSPNMSALAYSAGFLSTQSASASFPGVVNTGTQEFTGRKTFLSLLGIDAGTEFLHIGTPSNPPAGSEKLYFKTDGQLYMLNASGIESPVTGSGTEVDPFSLHVNGDNQMLGPLNLGNNPIGQNETVFGGNCALRATCAKYFKSNVVQDVTDERAWDFFTTINGASGKHRGATFDMTQGNYAGSDFITNVSILTDIDGVGGSGTFAGLDSTITGGNYLDKYAIGGFTYGVFNGVGGIFWAGTSSKSAGTIGGADSDSTTLAMGGYFSINSDDSLAFTPPNLKAALVADAGDSGLPIFIARAGGDLKFEITNAGNINALGNDLLIQNDGVDRIRIRESGSMIYRTESAGLHYFRVDALGADTLVLGSTESLFKVAPVRNEEGLMLGAATSLGGGYVDGNLLSIVTTLGPVDKIAATISATVNGSSQGSRALKLSLLQGDYSASSFMAGLIIDANVDGSGGAGFLSGIDATASGNYGVKAGVTGFATGANVTKGGMFNSYGTERAYGVNATADSDASTAAIGGYFAINSDADFLDNPPNFEVALVADSGDSGSDIFHARNTASGKLVSIDNSGNVILNGGAIQSLQLTTPSNPTALSNKLYFKADNNLYSLNSSGVEIQISSMGGEANTASNSGAGGVGLVLTKAGVDLPFKSINTASNRLSVVNDAGNSEIDLDVVEANLDITNMLNYVAPDFKQKVSSDDSTPNFTENKFAAGSTKLSIVTLNPGANEQLSIDVVEANIDVTNLLNYQADTYEQKISSDDSSPGFAEDKFVAGSTKVSLVTLNGGGAEQLEIDINEPNIDVTNLLNYNSAFHNDSLSKISVSDTAKYLEDVFVAGSTKLSVTVINPGPAENISLDVVESNVDHNNLLNWVAGQHTDGQLKLSSNDSNVAYGEDKFVAGSTKLSIVTINDGAAEQLSIDVVEANLNIESMLNWTANDNVDHSTVTLTAGAGLSGTGDITASRTFDVDIANETTVTAASGDLILIADVSDANNIKKVTAQTIVDLASSSIFGSQFSFVESLGSSSTTSGTYVEKLKLTTASIPAGDYYISWSFGLANSNVNKISGFQVQLDDTTVLQDGRITTPSASVPGPSGGHAVTTLTAAVHTIDIDYLAVSNTAIIENARITIWRAQ